MAVLLDELNDEWDVHLIDLGSVQNRVGHVWGERAVLLESLETSQPVFHYLGGCEAQADRRLQL